jgi:hypothetical protein
MFCPTCGKENALGRKFCVACGTNLEAVSQALSGSKTDFFTRTDAVLDQLVARYAEHVFKDAPANTVDATVGKSWKILGQAVASVSEHTTARLQDHQRQEQQEAVKTDAL